MQEEVEVMTTQDEMAADLTTFTMIFANVERWGYDPLIGFETEKNTVNLFACTECGNVVAVRGQQQEFTAQTNPLVIHATHCMGTTLGIRMVRARAKATEAVEAPQIESSEGVGGPYTRHGHAVEGITVVGPKRPSVARCGGPALCSMCAIDEHRIRQEHGKPLPEATIRDVEN